MINPGSETPVICLFSAHLQWEIEESVLILMQMNTYIKCIWIHPFLYKKCYISKGVC